MTSFTHTADWSVQTSRRIRKSAAIVLDDSRSRRETFDLLEIMEDFDHTPPCQCVVIRRNGNDGRKVSLDFSSVAVFGSEVDCDVRIRQDSVLPNHVSVHVDKSGRVFASSTDVENPASLNSQPLSKDVYIRNNDVLTIGDKSFRFEYLRTVLSPISTNMPNRVTPQGKKRASKSPNPAKQTPIAKSPAHITPFRDGRESRVSLTRTPISSFKVNLPENSAPSPTTPKAQKSPAKIRTPQTEPVKSRERYASDPSRRRSEQVDPARNTTPQAAAVSQNSSLCPATPQQTGNTSQHRTPQSAPPKSVRSVKTSEPSKRLSWALFQQTVEQPETEKALTSTSPPTKKGPKQRTPSPFTRRSSFTPHLKSTPYPSTASDRKPTPMPTSIGDSFRSRRSSTTTRSTSLLTSIQEEVDGFSPCQDLATPNKALFQESVLATKAKSNKRKSVTFGPQLSPEYFDKRLPAKTPIKRGSLPCAGMEQHPSFGVSSDLPDSLGIVEEAIHEDSSFDMDSVDSDEEGCNNTSTIAQCSSPFSCSVTLPSLGQSNNTSLNPTLEMIESDLESSYCSVGELSTSCFIGEASFVEVKRALQTPIRQGIEGKHTLNKVVKKALPTPVREDIRRGPKLRSLRSRNPRLVTPLRRAIEDKPSLRRVLRKINTPLKKQIESRPKLRQTKKTLPTPLKRAIHAKQQLKKTKKSMSTPLKKAIQHPPALRKTKNSMPTPLRKDIENPPTLRKTKNSMPTPLRKDIQNPPTLRKTKNSMPTPLRKDIQNPPTLRKTKNSMPTPLRKDIQNPPTLRKTKNSMPTPLRKDIQNPPTLRKTKNSMPTPLRKDIQNPPTLCKTKNSMPTPLRKDIQNPPTLCKTKNSMPTPLRKDIQNPPTLRKTKNSMPTPLRNDIQNPPTLRKTKNSMPTPLRKDIQNPPVLRRTKRSLPTPLKKEIQNPPQLRKTKESMPKDLQKEIQNPPTLRKTTRGLKRKRGNDGDSCETQYVISTAKRRRIAPVRRNVADEKTSIELDGVMELFCTPQPVKEAFNPTLYLSPVNRDNKVHFPSPVAKTAQKPFPAEENMPCKPIIKFAPVPLPDVFTFSAVSPRETRRNTRSNAKKFLAKANEPITKQTRSRKKTTRSTKLSSLASSTVTESVVRNTRSKAKRMVTDQAAAPAPKRKTSQKSLKGKSTVEEAVNISPRRTRSKRCPKPEDLVLVTHQTRSSTRKDVVAEDQKLSTRSTRSNPAPYIEPEEAAPKNKRRHIAPSQEPTAVEEEPQVRRTRKAMKDNNSCTQPVVRRSARLARK